MKQPEAARKHTPHHIPSAADAGAHVVTLAPHRFDKTVLREYDIRGIIGKTVRAQDAFALGATFGTYLRREVAKKTGVADKPLWVCVGYDGRLTSPVLEAALVDGLNAVGVNVDRLGLGPTPMTYFGAMDRQSDGAMMITGSHNPPEYNGFKMVLQGGAVYGQMIQDIGAIAAEGAFHVPTQKGEIRTADIRDAYVTRLLKDYNGQRDLTVVWDSGNGAAGEVLRRLTRVLPGKHILLFDEIDGTFPNHHPDPTVDKNLVDLQRAVAEHKADLGIGFDGDADRIGAVDDKGNVLRCDTLLMVYAREVLENHPGAPIIGDVKCSRTLFDRIAEMGGEPVMSRTGHSLVKAKMKELKSPLAGELSGHIFFADRYYGFDDALYCGIRLMNEVSNRAEPLSALMATLPQLCSTPEIRITADEAVKFALVDKVASHCAAMAAAEGDEVLTIDGVRYQTKAGWWLMRASNTQNCVVVRAEAADEGALGILTAQLEAALQSVGLSLADAIE